MNKFFSKEFRRREAAWNSANSIKIDRLDSLPDALLMLNVIKFVSSLAKHNLSFQVYDANRRLIPSKYELK